MCNTRAPEGAEEDTSHPSLANTPEDSPLPSQHSYQHQELTTTSASAQAVQAKAEPATVAKAETHHSQASPQQEADTADIPAVVEEATVGPAVQVAAAVQQETTATANATAVVVAVARADPAQEDQEPQHKVSPEQTTVPGEPVVPEHMELEERESLPR